MNQEHGKPRAHGHYSGPRAEWETDRSFENDQFVVQVNKLPLKVPKFSVSISAKSSQGRPMRFIPVRSEGQGIVRVRPILADLRELIDAAESYLQKQLQLAEDIKIDEMQQRELRKQPKGQEVRPGLKELSKRDREKRQRERERDEERHGG
jgi:hypothetical protein